MNQRRPRPRGAAGRMLCLAGVLALASALASTRAAHAQLARLATAPGDGGVSFQVDPYGGYGYNTYGFGPNGTGDALYDPVGAVGPSSTTWQSAVYLRLPGQSTFLTTGTVGKVRRTGNLPDPGFLSQNGVVATSAFSHAGLDWQLTQSVEDLLVAGDRLGTLLVQEYVISNPGPATIAFDLVRYYEGDLFLGLGAGVPDGGGRILVGPEELLFETDLAGEPAATTNLVGITACGGVTPLRGRYEVGDYIGGAPAFPDRISADTPLADVVYQDGPDPDQFVDAGLDYDVGIALANEFSLAPGQSALYVTTTVFGLLPPADVSQGCAQRGQAVAAAGADQALCPGILVQLDGSASFDSDSVPGGMPPSWSWDLDVAVDSSGNTIPDDDVDASGALVAVMFPAGTTIVQLTFTDDDGDVDTDLVTITVEDLIPPTVACVPEIIVDATSFAGASVSPAATAADDCDPAPGLFNDRTGGGGDATDNYPCGTTRVTFTATDGTGNTASCDTIVRVVPPSLEWPVGAALRVGKLPDERPRLDWSLLGAIPPELRFTVLRGEARERPITIAPGGLMIPVFTWDEPGASGPLIFYDVRTTLCDGTLSQD